MYQFKRKVSHKPFKKKKKRPFQKKKKKSETWNYLVGWLATEGSSNGSGSGQESGDGEKQKSKGRQWTETERLPRQRLVKARSKEGSKEGRVAAKLVSDVGFWFRFQPRPGLWREGEGWFFICVKWNYKNAIIAVRFGFYNFWTENWTEPKNAIIRSVRFLIQKIPNRKPKKTNPSDFFFLFRFVSVHPIRVC